MKKDKKEATKKFLSDEQKKNFKELVQDMEKMTIADLKEILGTYLLYLSKK